VSTRASGDVRACAKGVRRARRACVDQRNLDAARDKSGAELHTCPIAPRPASRAGGRSASPLATASAPRTGARALPVVDSGFGGETWEPALRPVAFVRLARSISMKWCRRAGWLLIAVCTMSCGGHQAGNSSNEPEPIAECQDYEAVLVKCTGSGTGIAKQTVARAKTDEDRTYIRHVCAINAERMRTACQ
jgi:hypothetical protein